MTSLSVLVPVFNEQYLVAESLGRLEVLADSPHLERTEVIVVDDCSTDDTARVLADFAASRAGSRLAWRFIRHERNGGKGAAIRTALAQATGELSVIHDADLEYHPRDLLHIVKVFVEEKADAVFGSRFAGGPARRVLLYRHQLGNKLLTFLCNLSTNLNLTDMETCYKAVRTSLLKSIPIQSNDFRLEPELTIKLAKRQARIFEVPISYSGRTYQEGKKINWRTASRRCGPSCATRSRTRSTSRTPTAARSSPASVARPSSTPGWPIPCARSAASASSRFGGGVGNLTLQLVPRTSFVVSDVNPLYLTTLESLRASRPYLSVEDCDVGDAASFPSRPDGFDTVICLNVVEHIKDDVGALANIGRALGADGQAIVLVPQGPWNFGTLDEVLGHERRYTAASITAAAEAAGLQVERILRFNRVGTLAWFLNGTIMRRRSFGLLQIKLLGLLTPIMRAVDPILPIPPLSLIAILKRRT